MNSATTSAIAAAARAVATVAPSSISASDAIVALLNRMGITGAKFVGVTYRAKESGEVSRYTVLVGGDYGNLVRKSLAEARAVKPVDNVRGSLDRKAKAEVLRSLRNTLENAKRGEQNDSYTKRNRYASVGNGVSVFDDGTFELRGIVVSRKVLEAGTHKVVKSRPLTIAKDAIRKQLSISKYRSLCLDAGAMQSLRCGGTEVEV